MTDHSKPQESVQPFLKIKPPLIGLALIGIGVGIHFAFPAQIFDEIWLQLVVGLPVAIGGLAFAMIANVAFHRADTDVTFSNPSAVIVQHGAHKYSRNPMYVGMVLIALGVMLAVNTAWGLLVLPVLILYFQYGVIRNEERYLEQWFGDEYRDYKSRVRRWL